MKTITRLLIKILCIGFLALLMLIPLAMIRGQIEDREVAMRESADEVAASWARPQTLSGPRIGWVCTASKQDERGKTVLYDEQKVIYPEELAYSVQLETQDLHRGIYDVKVYTSTIRMTGSFRVTRELLEAEETDIEFALQDLRGIEGEARIEVGGKSSRFSATDKTLRSIRETENEFLFDGTKEVVEKIISGKLDLNRAALTENETIPFQMTIRIKGTESLFIRPVGNVTEVCMESNCATPSFTGDFLPSEREVTDSGFTARWSVSEINRGAPESSELGVRLLQPVSRYQQVTRCLKYGILIVLLVFIAGFMVELVTRKEINLIQYLVIGLSLVLFYALLLSFSEFMSFGLSYALAAGMTVLALTGYFFGILKSKSAGALAGFVSFAYLTNYILLQMENYALITGTVILFLLLCAVMYVTKDLGKSEG